MNVTTATPNTSPINVVSASPSQNISGVVSAQPTSKIVNPSSQVAPTNTTAPTNAIPSTVTRPANTTPAPTMSPLNLAPDVMKFGNDTVTRNGNSYSVVTADPAMADYNNKQDFANQTSAAINQQAQNNNLLNASTPPPNPQNDLTKALNDATKALNGNSQNVGTAAGASAALNDLSAQLQAKYDQTQSQIQGIQNGTVPLTADQQAQVDQLKQQYATLRQKQQEYNQAYEGGVTMLGVRSGINRYAGMEQANRIQQAVDQGIQKLADLDAKANHAVNTLQQGFKTNNIKMVQQAYNDYADLINKKTDQIKTMNSMIRDEAKTVADQVKQRQDAVKDALKYATDNNIQQPFFSIGGSIFNTTTGQPVGFEDYQAATGQEGLPLEATDLSPIQNVTAAKKYQSGIIGEYEYYADSMMKEGKTPVDFNTYQNIDANRKRPVSVTNNYGASVKKEVDGVKAIINSNPANSQVGGRNNVTNGQAWDAAAKAIDDAYGPGTATKYDAVLKEAYLLPSVARDIASQPPQDLATWSAGKAQFIRENNYVSPEVAGRMYDNTVPKPPAKGYSDDNPFGN